ncbi:glycosyltransferase [Methylocapsa palsarum]|uniref:Glycosyltransferase involved in cell wall bisynthesis n=1 Tax=Methylocapsa palsarum TaxID=1612308 RepID=A0A1I3YSP5_9HYPH|nr:glycosyltransferase [Methylocapsa palsarum]SFK34884.1 Glycosyltransferase involved in cell wall bisynthesis [Methylocapsa palsarum]
MEMKFMPILGARLRLLAPTPRAERHACAKAHGSKHRLTAAAFRLGPTILAVLPHAIAKALPRVVARLGAAAPDRLQAQAGKTLDDRGRDKASSDVSRPLLYIDLTDVICHAIWHNSCAGIPRVQLEIATRLYRSDSDVCVFGRHRSQWWALGSLIREADGDIDLLFKLLKESFTKAEFSLAGIKAISRRRRRPPIPHQPQAPAFGPQDRLFIGGAFWIEPEIIRLARAAASAGAHLTVLFHDLIPLTIPAFTGHDFAAEYRAALRLPAHFVVTSELSRSQLKQVRLQIADVPGRTCTSVISLADEFPGSARNQRAIALTERLEPLADRSFALCVGTIEIRKNHILLIEAWRELETELGCTLPKLVIAGRRGWKADAAQAELDALVGDDPLMFIEAPSDAELRWLYASCQFTVFPSFFEGWGLPVGESFWFGKPCAVSSSQSIAPVARDLCVRFSPHSKEEMKDAIRSLLKPSTREYYRDKIEAAPLRTWSEVAVDIENLLAEARPVSAALSRAYSDRIESIQSTKICSSL